MSVEQHDYALQVLLDDVGPALLAYLFSPPDIERARTLHTELRKVLALLAGTPTW